MRVVFNGVIEHKKKGCAVCGHRSVSKSGFLMKKTYILPSGQSKTFVYGKPEEVSERDARFLLSYTYKDENGTRSVFELIDED